tara:strand:+ start:126 stop:533 length:408 start_codon:yes stop_codon:yes gene_type:complete
MTYYDILEIKSTATREEIKSAYKKLVLKWHPDKNDGNCDDKIKEITEAYDILGDESKKQEYDIKLKQKEHQQHVINPFAFFNNGNTININLGNANINFTMNSTSMRTEIIDGKPVTKKITTTIKNGVKTVQEEII